MLFYSCAKDISDTINIKKVAAYGITQTGYFGIALEIICVSTGQNKRNSDF